MHLKAQFSHLSKKNFNILAKFLKYLDIKFISAGDNIIFFKEEVLKIKIHKNFPDYYCGIMVFKPNIVIAGNLSENCDFDLETIGTDAYIYWIGHTRFRHDQEKNYINLWRLARNANYK